LSFYLSWPGQRCSYLFFSRSWDDKHIHPCLAIGWDGVLQTFLPRLGWSLYFPNLSS
jgi:hypothetical protein